jgi:predicted nucleic acid-binding protein
MRFEELASGASIFIDANIFIYHFTGASEECSEFLNRCESREITGVTSINVILEVLHRLMMIEAVNKNLVQPPNILKKLKNQPQKIKQLDEYFIHTQKIERMGISIRPFSYLTVISSQNHRMRYGLMVNDSLIVALMEETSVIYLATKDKSFTGIKEITVVSPEDLYL